MVFVPSVAQAQTATERAALVALYDATDGDNWTNNDNWKSTEPVGTWEGVTVENGAVTGLYLHSNNLRGELPSEIGNLTRLERLSLGGNFTGAIPTEIGNLTRLEWLDLSHNTELTGELPAGLRLLPVTVLDIRNTCITAPADSDFQAWLAGIAFFDTDRVCAAGITAG